MTVHVSGDYRAGVTIVADRPTHLDPTNRLGQQIMVLTPAMVESLYHQLHSKKCQEPRS